MFFKNKNKNKEEVSAPVKQPVKLQGPKTEVLVDGETLFSCWWSAFKFFKDCTIYIALSNYRIAQSYIEPTLKQLQVYPQDKLDDYLKEQERIIQFLGDASIANFLAKFAETDEIYSNYIFLNNAQNLKIRFFKGIEYTNKTALMGVPEELVDVIAFAQYRMEEGAPMLLITESKGVLNFIKDSEIDIPYRDIT